MSLILEWQRASELKPRCPMVYREYEELVRWFGMKGAFTFDYERDELDELLDRLDHGVCP